MFLQHTFTFNRTFTSIDTKRSPLQYKQVPFCFNDRLKRHVRFRSFTWAKTNEAKHLHIRRSFLSDVSLYNLSYSDIFAASVIHNLCFSHLPLLFLYRHMHLTIEYSARLLLVVSCIQTLAQLFILTYMQ